MRIDREDTGKLGLCVIYCGIDRDSAAENYKCPDCNGTGDPNTEGIIVKEDQVGRVVCRHLSQSIQKRTHVATVLDIIIPLTK